MLKNVLLDAKISGNFLNFDEILAAGTGAGQGAARWPWPAASGTQPHPSRPGVGALSAARSRLDQSRFSRPNTHFAAFFKIYKKIIFSRASSAKFCQKMRKFCRSFHIFWQFFKILQNFQKSARFLLKFADFCAEFYTHARTRPYSLPQGKYK